MFKPTVLIILDGWGVAPPSKGNAVTLASTPIMDSVTRDYFYTTLQASGPAVGLPFGETGSSEVGHLNIGAGRIIKQALPKIDNTIRDGSFFKNEILLQAIKHAQKNNSRLHLMGLLSDGNVHSSEQHLFALLELVKNYGVKDVYIHAFLDGRDTPPRSGLKYIRKLENKIEHLHLGKIATLMGRYFAMDRNEHWERTEKAYNAMVKKKGKLIADPKEAIKKFYQEGKTDEFIDPTIICANTRPISQVRDNDSIIFFNFRPDRARQLTRAFVLPTFPNFNRGGKIENLFFVTIVRYDIPLPVKIAFKVGEIKNPLAKVISDHGSKQLHTAETEKYAHVTSFFDGGRDEPFPGEDFKLIPSPRVEEYNQKPEMSAYVLTQFLISALDAKKYDFILVNYANPDMVGHTGNLKATIKAVEVVDECLGKVIEKTNKLNGASVITADHGNAEEMINPSTGEMNKEHSTNPVPFVIVSDISKSQNSNKQIYKVKKTPIPTGLLSDIAPTVLKLMDLPKPKEMTGDSLI